MRGHLPMRHHIIQRPIGTHFRSVDCERAECPNFLHGFEVHVDETAELGQRQAAYLRDQLPMRSDRPIAAEYRNAEGLTVFRFAPGTECMASSRHRVPNDRTPVMTVRTDGLGDVRHTSVDSFVDDLRTHIDVLRPRYFSG